MIERKRPLKQFEVLQAFGPYRKGDTIQPTGCYRDVLVRRGLIKEVVEPVNGSPLVTRMVEVAEETVNRAVLRLPKRGKAH